MAILYSNIVSDGSIANEGDVIILLCMIVMSVSISMVIFACNDSGEFVNLYRRYKFGSGGGGGDGSG